MNFSSYFILSSLVVAGVVAHAYVGHEQFYPAVVYLSTDKMCLAVMYNFAFALFVLFGKVLLRVFIGTLRDLEVEQLVDSGRGFLADTILFLVFYAPTIDNREVGTVYSIQYICCVIFMKVFHLTTQIRVSHMFEVGVPRLIVNIKLVALMCLLLGCDLMALQYFYSVASRSSTFFTWILFEVLTMSTVVLVSICKYSVHMIDLRLDSGWPGKSVCLFYVDLVHDVVSMTLFLVFMLTFFVQNPSRLPIYMMADVIQVARKLAQRLRSFRRYRRISLNMEVRFPDATDEEIEQNEHCVICRDSLFEGSKPKKLQCNHIFHIDCLRSWLVMQQVCPTCRAEIPADAPSLPEAAQHARERAPAPAPVAGAAALAAAPAAPAVPAPVQAALSAAAASAPAGVGQAPSTAASTAAVSGGLSRALAGSSVQPTATASAPAAPSPHVGAAASAASASWGVPTSATPHERRHEEQEARGLGNAPAAALPALPPVNDILEALKKAEDIAKFLREQTDFWMDQVRQIEQQQIGSAAGSTVGIPGLPSTTPLWPFLSVPAAAAMSSAVRAEAASAPSGSAPSGSAPSGSAPSSGAAGTAPAASASREEGPGVACGAGEGSPPPLSDEGDRGQAGDGSGELCDQIAELRRAQQELWERRRSNSTLGAGGPGTP